MKYRGHGCPAVLDLLAEGVRQTGESSHGHPHREVLSLHVGRGNVLRVGIAGDVLDLAAKAHGGAVPLTHYPIRPITSRQSSRAPARAGPDRSYRTGTTTMLRAVELRRPNVIRECETPGSAEDVVTATWGGISSRAAASYWEDSHRGSYARDPITGAH